MSVLVMKFGGTSVGNPEAIQRSATLASSQQHHHDVVVIVSALSGITNLLIDGAHKAANDREKVSHYTHTFLKRHLNLVDALHLSDIHTTALINQIQSNSILLYNSLFYSYQAGHASPDLLDEILAVGELTSASIFTTLLKDKNVQADEIDARKIIFTDDTFTCARVNFERTNQSIRQFIQKTLQAGHIAVVPGFVGHTTDGRTTTLGRGASDYSASIIAAALDADEIWNWTDVDGVHTIDPRLNPSAQVIPTLTYTDMARLSIHGAKVLHPDSIAPLELKHIPLRIKNSYRPQQPGTLIHSDQSEQDTNLLAIGVIHHTQDDQDLTEITIINGAWLSKPICDYLEKLSLPIITKQTSRKDDCLILTIRQEDEQEVITSLYPILFPGQKTINKQPVITPVIPTYSSIRNG